MKKRVNYSGTWYSSATPADLVAVLEGLRASRVRVVLDYGDTMTGRSWGETCGIRGTISRSIGPEPIPLLVHNSRSMGGGALLDGCILTVRESRGGRLLWEHPIMRTLK